MTTGSRLPSDVRQGLEALLFLSDEPIPVPHLAELLGVAEEQVAAELVALAAEFEESRRGMEIREAAGGWRMYSAAGAREVVERWTLLGRSGRLTQAALETLAVIAYKQPIGRQEIGDIRGVNADGAVRSLVARGFVEEVGRDPGAGHAVLYGTTTSFLERLGLNSLDELPPLTDYLPEAPAPDEPELGGLKEIRRRLAAGDDLPSRRLGGRDDAATNTGAREEEDADDDGGLPAPSGTPGRPDEREMDELTDRLERAARSAADRLRQAIAANEAAEQAHDTDVPDPDAELATEPGDDDGS